MGKSFERLHGIVCYWEYRDGKHRDERSWHLVESFPIDDDGHCHCLTTPSTGGDDRQEWHKWTNSTVYRKKDGTITTKDDEEMYYDDYEPIMGRAVTIWTMQHGTSLLDLHPPGEDFPKWLSASFYEELCKLQNWATLLERGYDLYFGTTREAEKYLFKEE